MDVGVCVASRVKDIDYVVLAERLGFSHAWMADSQMLWSDVFASLALAADRTDTINVGTGVAVSGTRPAAVNAAGIPDKCTCTRANILWRGVRQHCQAHNGNASTKNRRVRRFYKRWFRCSVAKRRLKHRKAIFPSSTSCPMTDLSISKIPFSFCFGFWPGTLALRGLRRWSSARSFNTSWGKTVVKCGLRRARSAGRAACHKLR